MLSSARSRLWELGGRRVSPRFYHTTNPIRAPYKQSTINKGSLNPFLGTYGLLERQIPGKTTLVKGVPVAFSTKSSSNTPPNKDSPSTETISAGTTSAEAPIGASESSSAGKDNATTSANSAAAGTSEASNEDEKQNTSSEENTREEDNANEDDDDDGPSTVWESILLFLQVLVGMGAYALAVGGTAAMFTHQCLTKWNAYHSSLRLLWDGERIFNELDVYCEEIDETSRECLEFLGESPQVWHANLTNLRKEQARRLQERKLVDEENIESMEKSNAVWWMPGWLGLFRSSDTSQSKEFRFEWWRLRQQVRSLHDVKVQQMTQELRALHHEGLSRLREVRDEVPKWALLMGWGEEDLYRGIQQVSYSLTRLRVIEAETRALMHQMGEGGFEDMWRVYHEAADRVAARRRQRLAQSTSSTDNEEDTQTEAQ
eukprot:gb/GECG01005681.1/.p1 GENE.gb/GECG01005681.1/~~gb/GECG01005681.1/.p1  ORF type:complete len:430 (+),score=69.85 gb/GECG01005681.1/:1-1290(+)